MLCQVVDNVLRDLARELGLPWRAAHTEVQTHLIIPGSSHVVRPYVATKLVCVWKRQLSVAKRSAQLVGRLTFRPDGTLHISYGTLVMAH